MIAPMKRVWVLVMDSERLAALKGLRKLGLLHAREIAGSGPDHGALLARLAETDRAIGLLTTIELAKGAGPSAAGDDIVAGVLAAAEREKRVQEESSSIAKELERVQGWGDFEPSDIGELERSGRPIRLFEAPAKRLASLPPEIEYLTLAAPKGRARIAVLDAPGTPAEVPDDLVAFSPPMASAAKMRERLAELARELKSSAEELASFAARLPEVKAERRRIESALTLETLRSGMESEGPVAFLSGYVPAKELPALSAQAKARGWGLVSDDPSDDELPPTKVENPAFIRIIDPVFAFLGTVPNYREYDISAPFLIFFSLFFAMIFGDAAYGSIMLAAGIFAAVKAKTKGGKVPDAIRLLLVLGSVTMAWGAATATWFAIPPDRLPGFLRAIAIPAVMSGNPEANTNVKIFCFMVGAVHLALAHLKNIKRDFPNPKFLAQVGSLSLVIGMFTAVLNLVVDPARFPIPVWALGLIGGGFLLVFAFGNWNGNLLKSIVEGLKGIIPTFLGTVSVFADIVSYIRLWAVGLAGLAISQTVNGMAGGLFRVLVGMVFGVILLVVGHSLNLAMSVLSVVVHGIRLNTLEFSSHLGMEWSGYKYDPFRETVREDSAD